MNWCHVHGISGISRSQYTAIYKLIVELSAKKLSAGVVMRTKAAPL